MRLAIALAAALALDAPFCDGNGEKESARAEAARK
jgi:hypothetical protein